MELSMLLESKHPGTEVFNNLKSFPGGEYGANDPEEFVDTFSHTIMMYPDRAHLLVSVGEPGSGKSTVLYQMLAHMLLPYEIEEEGEIRTVTPPLKQFIDDNGYEVQVHMAPWGDASERLDPSWEIDKTIDYHRDTLTHEAKQREVNYSERIVRTAIHKTIEETNTDAKNGKKIIHILAGDLPVNTGDVIGDQRVGILRAYDLMKDLMQRNKEFGDLAYELSCFAMSASEDVRNKAYGDRTLLTEAQTEKEKIAALEAQGMHINTTDDEDIALIAQESASPDQMRMIERDINDVLLEIYPLHDERTRPDSYAEAFTLDTFKNSQFRIRTIGVVQLPRLLSEVLGAAPTDLHVGNFYNESVSERVDVFPGIVNRHPISELLEDGIIDRIKAEEAGAKPPETVVWAAEYSEFNAANPGYGSA
jgi:ABC-type dipeptide/oligopeptide/nickel transport system ATPase component